MTKPTWGSLRLPAWPPWRDVANKLAQDSAARGPAPDPPCERRGPAVRRERLDCFMNARAAHAAVQAGRVQAERWSRAATESRLRNQVAFLEGRCELAVAVGYHHQFLGILCLAPGGHHERVVDRYTGDGVDAFGLDLVGIGDVARDVSC